MEKKNLGQPFGYSSPTFVSPTSSMGAAAMSVVDKKYCSDEERELTVRKTSVFFPGDGFEAYDHRSGELVFRLDTYQDRGHDHQLVLMDPYGSPILTVRRKWPSLHQRWEGFVGERSEGQDPLFSVRRSSIFGEGRRDVAVDLHGIGIDIGGEYRIEGSFAQRNSEIKRKVEPCANVVLSKDVFCLCVKQGIDAAFVMGVLLVLDQITGDDDDDAD